jgi:hypothetical protein
MANINCSTFARNGSPLQLIEPLTSHSPLCNCALQEPLGWTRVYAEKLAALCAASPAALAASAAAATEKDAAVLVLQRKLQRVLAHALADAEQLERQHQLQERWPGNSAEYRLV